MARDERAHTSLHEVLLLVVLGLGLSPGAQALTDEEIAESDRLLELGDFQSAEALYRAAFERDSTDAQALLRLVYALISQERVDAAAEYLDYLIDHDYQYLSEFVPRWGRHSHVPHAVVRTVLAISDPEQRAQLLLGAAAGWAESDPAAAQDAILTLPAGELRDAALAGLVRGMANTGLIATPAALSAFSSDSARQAHALSAIVPLTRHDPSVARAFIDAQISDPEMRERALRMYSLGLSQPSL